METKIPGLLLQMLCFEEEGATFEPKNLVLVVYMMRKENSGKILREACERLPKMLKVKTFKKGSNIRY